MGALIDVTAAHIASEVLVSAQAGAGEGAVAVGAGGVLATVCQGGSREPVVSALVDVQTPPVSAGADTLVSITAVQVRLTAVAAVSAPGVRGAPPPAAQLSALVAVYLRQVGVVGQGEVSPVRAACAALVVVACSGTLRVAAAGTLAVTAGPVRAAASLTAVVSLVPGAARLSAAVVSAALQQAGTLGVGVTVSLTFTRHVFILFYGEEFKK